MIYEEMTNNKKEIQKFLDTAELCDSIRISREVTEIEHKNWSMLRSETTIEILIITIVPNGYIFETCVLGSIQWNSTFVPKENNDKNIL